MPIRSTYRPKTIRTRVSRPAVQSATKDYSYQELVQTIRELRELKAKHETELRSILTRIDEQYTDQERKIKELSDEIRQQVNEKLSQIRDGEDGQDAPTLDEILTAVLPYVDDGEDGHTPTEEELLALIKPLIPEVKNGRTPTKEELLALIKPLIPKVENGKDADEKKIIATLEKKIPQLPNIAKMIEDEAKKLIEPEVEKMKTTLRSLSSKVTLGGGGGGMGNILFFKFTCDGSTTEFTLPGIPTQEGAAVFAYYQSARLHNNEHFTVSGTTMTTTFTAENGQIIDGYIIT